ncbi:hypothetical protein ABB02_01810 [Clostridiaceae bacterium JG1575]|nr:hypothetical protein ABB02_01810 [Clostridiaceae bacterium JG1575]
MNIRVKKIPLSLWYVVTLVMNFLGAMGVLGQSQREVSDSLPNLFVPAPFTFAIWFVIYLGSAWFLIHQFRQKDEEYTTFLETKINPLFAEACLFNVAWIISFSRHWIGISTLFILIYYAFIVAIMERIRKRTLTPAQRLGLKVPMALYLGWLSVAVIANITAWLVDLGWDRFGWSEALWLYIALVLGLVVLSALIFRHRCPVIALVGLWAFFGILYRHLTEKAGAAPLAPIILAVAMAVLLLDGLFVLRSPNTR